LSCIRVNIVEKEVQRHGWEEEQEEKVVLKPDLMEGSR